MADTNRPAPAPLQKVVVVNGDTQALETLETVLDAGRYDMVFVESGDGAYSLIKELRPHLVVLYAGIEDLSGFELLTLLKLDSETRHIPVLAYVTGCEGQDSEGSSSQNSDEENALLPSTVRMQTN